MSTTLTNMQTCGYDPNGVAVNDYLQRTYDIDPKKRKQVLSELCPCKTMVRKPPFQSSFYITYLKDLNMTFCCCFWIDRRTLTPCGSALWR